MEYKVTMPEIEIRLKKSDVHKFKIQSSLDCANAFRQMYSNDSIEIYESFFVVYLNRANKTVGWLKVSQGGLTGTVVDARLIMKSALDCLACGIILCHNHPSGNLAYSNADKVLTEKIVKAANLFDIQVLDHIILTADSYYSFADNSLL